MLKQIQLGIRNLVRSRDDIQDARKQTDSRLKRKKNKQPHDTVQALPDPKSAATEALRATSDALTELEHKIDKEIKKSLKEMPIWTRWLQHQIGIGPAGAAWLLGFIDIERAQSPSAIHQLFGLNGNMVKGKKDVLASEYKGEWPIIKTYESKEGKLRYILQTALDIRGDKLTKGFVAPYNARLRAALMGAIGTGLFQQTPDLVTRGKRANYSVYTELKQQRRKMYDACERITHVFNKKTQEYEPKRWCDCSPMHRENAARRFAMKLFLTDLYIMWRGLEGLPVKESYEHVKLGMDHPGKASRRILDQAAY